MGAGVDRSDSFTRQVRVELGRADTRMTKQLLDDAQVGAALEEMRRERVPQRMWADAIAEAGAGRRALDRRPRLLAREPPPAIAEEQGPAVGRRHVAQREERRAPLGEPAAQPLHGDLADG